MPPMWLGVLLLWLVFNAWDIRRAIRHNRVQRLTRLRDRCLAWDAELRADGFVPTEFRPYVARWRRADGATAEMRG